MTDGPTQPTSEGSSVLDGITKVVIEAGLLGSLMAAVVFVTGWSYADRYFGELGLNLSAMDGLSTDSLSGYAFWVFRDGIMLLLAVAAQLAMIVAYAAIGRVPLRRTEVVAGMVVLGIAGLLAAGWLGSARAAHQVATVFRSDYQTFPRVLVEAKSPSTLATFFTAHGELGRSTCLRKVFMDRRNLYVYAAYESARDLPPEIYILPLSETALVKVVQNPGLCRP